jgi:hypothetical protein
MPRPLHFGYPRARFAGPARPRRVLAGLAARPHEDQVPGRSASLPVGSPRVLLPWFCRSGRAVLSVGVVRVAAAAVLLGWSPAR